MVKLITSINGVSCALFHVEQFPGQSWQWRWRILGDYPPEYVKWRENLSVSPRAVFFPEIAGCVVEAQWRRVDGEEWCQAALHEAASGTAVFRVRALTFCHFPEGFTAMAAVNDLVAVYDFLPLTLPAGVVADVIGTAQGAFVDNVLLDLGEFRAADARMVIENTGPSTGALVPASGEARLRMAPGAALRHVFAVSSGSISVPLVNPTDPTAPSPPQP